jgi:predicted GIY-YIG superfamily endonuclease
MVLIYILECAQNKIYVGKTTNMEARWRAHSNGCGSEWTKLYKPIGILEEIENGEDFDELKHTLRYMKEKGMDNVRGSCFCEIIFSSETREFIQRLIDSSNDACYKCGKKNHYARDCTLIGERLEAPIETL